MSREMNRGKRSRKSAPDDRHIAIETSHGKCFPPLDSRAKFRSVTEDSIPKREMPADRDSGCGNPRLFEINFPVSAPKGLRHRQRRIMTHKPSEAERAGREFDEMISDGMTMEIVDEPRQTGPFGHPPQQKRDTRIVQVMHEKGVDDDVKIFRLFKLEDIA